MYVRSHYIGSCSLERPVSRGMSLPSVQQIRALVRRERHLTTRFTRNSTRLHAFSTRFAAGVPDVTSSNEASRGSIFSSDSDSDSPVSIEELVASVKLM